MTEIPDNIKRNHIIEAIREIDREGVPSKYQSKDYDLIHEDKPYPPKYVILLANKIVNGTDIKDFHSGQAVRRLKKLGFDEIINKTPTSTLKSTEKILGLKQQEEGSKMLIEGNDLNPNRKEWLSDHLKRNHEFLYETSLININSPPILVKYIEKEIFDEIFEVPPEILYFYKEFINLLRKRYGEDNKEDVDPLNNYVRKLIKYSVLGGEHIIVFVSDRRFDEIGMKYPSLIDSPGIYVKKRETYDVDLDFAILFCLIEAQIYYSLSRKAIFSTSRYKGVIDYFFYSAMALNSMKKSELESLLKHQKNALEGRGPKLVGSWAIPIDLLNLPIKNNITIVDILDENLIRNLLFGEYINDYKFMDKILTLL